MAQARTAEILDLGRKGEEFLHAHPDHDIEHLLLDIQDIDDMLHGNAIRSEGGGLDFADAALDRGDGAGIGQVQGVGAGIADGDLGEFRHVFKEGLQENGGFLRQHGTGGIADGDGGCAGFDDLFQEGAEENSVGTGGIDGGEFHIGGDCAALLHGVHNPLGQGVGLQMGKIFHLDGADGGRDLEPGLPGVLQGGEDEIHSVVLKGDGHGDAGVPDGLGDGTNEQGIDLFLADGFELDEIDTQLVQEPAELDGFAEAELRTLFALAQGAVTDPDCFGISHG